MADSDERSDGWATSPQDTREQTCEYNGTAPFSVMYSLRVARAPDPSTTTVARTCGTTVEWTTTMDLPSFLATVAETCTPYGGDRFGRGSTDPDVDERFRAAPVDATVRPSSGASPALSDPYHYWNTPLARLRADDHFPGGVSRVTVDLADGPDAVWTDEAIAGVLPERLPRDRTAYNRVGLEFTARERLERSTDGEDWQAVGDPTPPDTGLLLPAVDATLADPLRDGPDGGDTATRGDDPIADAVDAVERHVAAVWSAFRRTDRDPYSIPTAAVETATTSLE